MNGSKPNLAGRNYVTKEPTRKFRAYSMCGAITRLFFVCSYVASPFGPLRTEKTTDFGVESRDPTANLCPSSKVLEFLRVGRKGIEKVRFSGFWGWVFCLTLCPNPNLWPNIYWYAKYRDGLPVSLSRCAKFGDFSFSLLTSGDAELRIAMP